MRRDSSCLLAIPLFCLCAAGCHGSAPEVGGRAFGPEIRDSSGIAIIESSEPAWPAGEGWTVQDSPLLEIGAIEGDQPLLFEGIRGPTRARDGRVFLIETGTCEIRVFDSLGNHQFSFGGKGEGPGEFRYPPTVLGITRSDTVVVIEEVPPRRTWFTLSGDFVRSEMLPWQDLPANLLGAGPLERHIFDDGSFFQVGTLPPSNAELVGNGGFLPGPGMGRYDVQLGLVRADNTEAVFGRFPLAHQGYPDGLSREEQVVIYDEFFAPTLTTVSHSPPAYHIATPGAREVKTYDLNGALRRIQRLNLPLESVTEDLVESFRLRAERTGTSKGAPVGKVRALMDQVVIPEEVFPYSDLLTDPEGNLWLLQHDQSAERGDFQWSGRWRSADGTADFHVVHPTEGWVGTVSIPREAGVVREVGIDYVLTVRIDEFDVPYVRVYRLEKGK